MSNIRLLDCTLRDGGYINNWEFGEQAICAITQGIVNAGIDIVEVGFLKDEPYQENRAVFRDVQSIQKIIGQKKKGALYAVMIEATNPIPIEQIVPFSQDVIDMIRVVVWKSKRIDGGVEVDALEDAFDYCKKLIEKGYKVSIQPARTEQYSEIEFRSMLKKINQMHPYAVYVVDSWGTQTAEKTLEYLCIADEILNKDIAIGYHGHNNLLQAFGTAQEIVKMNLCRDIILDASIYGMGRGAGNLNLEIIAEFLWRKVKKRYDIFTLLNLYEKYIKPIYQEKPWGYSMEHFITSIYGCNPQYANFYGKENKISVVKLPDILSNFKEEEKIMFDRERAKGVIQ